MRGCGGNFWTIHRQRECRGKMRTSKVGSLHRQAA
jgi:hypothetical protein